MNAAVLSSLTLALSFALAAPAAAKPVAPVEITISPAELAGGTRQVAVSVLSHGARTVRLEVLTSGGAELASPAPRTLKLVADKPALVTLKLRQHKDEEAHLLVRAHTERGAREASIDLAPDVTERKRKATPPPPVDRTADGQKVMR